jgi:hypothetical protein
LAAETHDAGKGDLGQSLVIWFGSDAKQLLDNLFAMINRIAVSLP